MNSPEAIYNEAFYASRHEDTVHSANAILGLVREHFPMIKSAVDVGCGTGTWLSQLSDVGVKDILGIDGPWVDRRFLQIPPQCFLEANIALDFPLVDRRFDLAVSLEVAEHLLPERAEPLVEFLTKLSDIVLFSAAIPNQTGNGHINEQWPAYWQHYFKEKGYIGLDVIRRCVWEDSLIPFWYKQNTFVYVTKNFFAQSLNAEKLISLPDALLPLVHPDLLALHVKQASKAPSLSYIFNLFKRYIKSFIKTRVSVK